MTSNRGLSRRLLALETRNGSKIGDDCAHLSEIEMLELIGFWTHRLDGEDLSEDEHGRFLSLDGKIVRSGNWPFSQASDDELNAALLGIRHRIVRRSADSAHN